MAKQTLSITDQLRAVVNETAGSAMTMSPNESGWSAYILQQKHRIEDETLEGLCKQTIEWIKEKRIETPKPEKETKRKIKPFKIEKQ